MLTELTAPMEGPISVDGNKELETVVSVLEVHRVVDIPSHVPGITWYLHSILYKRHKRQQLLLNNTSPMLYKKKKAARGKEHGIGVLRTVQNVQQSIACNLSHRIMG